MESYYSWYRKNIPLYRVTIDFAGENFMIRPSDRFRTEAFTGSWISPEYRKYSELKLQGKNESDVQVYNQS